MAPLVPETVKVLCELLFLQAEYGPETVGAGSTELRKRFRSALNPLQLLAFTFSSQCEQLPIRTETVLVPCPLTMVPQEIDQT